MLRPLRRGEVCTLRSWPGKLEVKSSRYSLQERQHENHPSLDSTSTGLARRSYRTGPGFAQNRSEESREKPIRLPKYPKRHGTPPRRHVDTGLLNGRLVNVRFRQAAPSRSDR